MSPRAEDSLTPKDRPYGERVQEERFLAATEPVEEMSPVAAPAQPVEQPVAQEAEPIDVQVQQLGEFAEPDLFDDDDEVSDLLSEEFDALAEGGLEGGDIADEEVRGLLWFPVLNELASRPGASTGMRQLAAVVKRRIKDIDG